MKIFCNVHQNEFYLFILFRNGYFRNIPGTVDTYFTDNQTTL